jgi:hypothetical protein
MFWPEHWFMSRKANSASIICFAPLDVAAERYAVHSCVLFSVLSLSESAAISASAPGVTTTATLDGAEPAAPLSTGMPADPPPDTFDEV